MNAHDAAAHILAGIGQTRIAKLHELLYYAQGWSLIWDKRPLFDDRIDAWGNGPVVLSVHKTHTDPNFAVDDLKGSPTKLDRPAAETVNAVTNYYGHHSALYLTTLTRRKEPWRLARQASSTARRSNAVISLASMAKYYGSLC